MTNLELQIINWHERRFKGSKNVPATYKKLLEEIGELGEALMVEDERAIMEEAGDCALILTHLLPTACPGKSLQIATVLALEKVEARLRRDELAPEVAKMTKPAKPEEKGATP